MDDEKRKERRTHRMMERAILDEEDDETMKQLPPEVALSEEFQASSLALRMVHQLLRPTTRRAVLELGDDRLTAAEALRAALAAQAVVVLPGEADALLKEALATKLWATGVSAEWVVIPALPPSALPPPRRRRAE